MAEPRLTTGTPGFDEVLRGGLPAQRSHLIVGAPGTGKTVLALQYLLEGRRQGEAGLYISLGEPAGEIERNARSLGWQLDGIDLVDLNPPGSFDTFNHNEYHVFPPSEVEQVPMWQGISQAVTDKHPQRLVIDPVTQLRYLSTDEYQFRRHILSLIAFLNRTGCSSLLLEEPTALERDTSLALAADSVVRLHLEVSNNRVIGLRSLEIQKLRGADFLSGRHSMRISSDGITVFPHRIEKADGPRPGDCTLSSNIRELDDLLGGGLESGTSMIITGPSGVGKTTVSVQFLATAAAANRRAILYSFEESVESIATRCRSIGIPIDALLEAGTLQLTRVNPMELYPDEFLAMVRAAVEQDDRQVIALDSVRGYEISMEQFGTPLAHIHNLVNYLNHQKVTLLMINEVEFITGDLRATEIGISHLTDGIILMRYAESAGQIIKVIGCLKKRLRDFQTELRQLRITPRGIEVSEKLEHLRGILTGVPTDVRDGRGSRKHL